jgi:hypothetical protein
MGEDGISPIFRCRGFAFALGIGFDGRADVWDDDSIKRLNGQISAVFNVIGR